ncbi:MULTISPECIES: LysR family transcriptional regulator [Halomonadaceae]|uniref:LysR family transcriptional regulator n=1 Tax=Halomonadaceae TaxID=28256 RepID=UPI001582A990|nr:MULTISPECIES: LysR family transcriptional regulator [Halomonas]MDI4638876.1 LysR family transcriptional regulator [Halomonas sp. BMC7]NUJ59865.1 LysR family transcriptional regulator [Halomonas taeanensis]
MLQPQWLRTFEALVELGNFTRAAERLDLTQAAVSQHIKHLEARLGPLLLRQPRSLELTPAGHALLDYQREMQAADQRLRQRLAGDDASQGELSLITPGSIGLAIYPHLLALQHEAPGLAIRHRFAPTAEVIDAVLDNRAELGLATQRPEDPRLAVSLFAKEALELVVPAGAEVAGWDDLVGLGFIDHPDGHDMATRLLSRRFPGNPGVGRLPRHGFTNQIGLILEPVARGLGFSVLPRFAREAYPHPETIRVVEGAPGVVDTLWLLHRAEWPLSARAQRAVERLKARLVSAPSA